MAHPGQFFVINECRVIRSSVRHIVFANSRKPARKFAIAMLAISCFQHTGRLRVKPMFALPTTRLRDRGFD
ncbi:hypothetical protein KCP78_19010 [Salmonella enterica subsp. enterica]|nr:hypothetical protein KCP78_19010 [Salmonella enterica subsp. enterica]